MDLVLFIITLCFRGSSEKRNYAPIQILSIIGVILTLILGIVLNWLYILDFIWYIVIIILASTASNQITYEDKPDKGD